MQSNSGTTRITDHEEVATGSTQGSSGDPEKNKEPDKKAFLDLKKFSKSGPEMLSADFRNNLEQNRLAEAQKLLVAAEERLFGSNKPARAEEEEGKLTNNYQYFIAHLELIIKDSFIEDNHERLKNAVTAILQEEAQDKRWETLAKEKRPAWRPTRCREIHKDVVEKRMKNTDEQENRTDKLSSPLKREVYRLGKQIQKDLLVVVRRLRKCYPPDFDICKIYAQLYHQAFSTRLQELTRSNVDIKDCCYILSWIVFHYPSDVLNHKELKEHIDQSSLGPLLPEANLKILHDQYFLHKEKEVNKSLSNAFGKEIKKWNDGIEPQLMNGYYVSSLAADIIRIRIRIRKRYMKNLEKLIKVKQGGAAKTLCANLVNIHTFRKYAQQVKSLFPEKTKRELLCTLANIKSVCHQYFLSQIHEELKPLYRKLWTDAWRDKHDKVLDGLVTALENQIHKLKPLKSVCREELLGELHLEVMVEYVRQMMKRKLKLKGKKQEEAAEFMCQDSRRICSTFANTNLQHLKNLLVKKGSSDYKKGSNERWLSEILPRLSEILRLQDPGSLKLEIVALARIYPDLSEQHVVAVLTLKSNLSSSDVCGIKDCLRDNRETQDDQSSPSFFSKVIVKKEIF